MQIYPLGPPLFSLKSPTNTVMNQAKNEHERAMSKIVQTIILPKMETVHHINVRLII